MTDGSPPQTVYLVDDDRAMLDVVGRILASSGYRSEAFATAAECLQAMPPEPAGCVVADVRMPQLDGLAAQRLMTENGVTLPVIFVSGYADVALSVRAMQQGAFTFLTKPFREQDILDAVADALGWEERTREERRELRRLRTAERTLSTREREIMGDVTDGVLNKTIAARLGLSEVTVKLVRSRIMHKMGATSIAQLARIAERLRR